MNGTKDFALETLKAVAEEIGTDLSEGAIERIYAIQKRHQFDADRSVSSQEMQRLIEALASEAQGGSE